MIDLFLFYTVYFLFGLSIIFIIIFWNSTLHEGANVKGRTTRRIGICPINSERVSFNSPA